MGEKKLREFLTVEELQTEIVNWSWNTIKRRVKDEGFPAIKDGASFLFDREKVRLWMKKREVQG